MNNIRKINIKFWITIGILCCFLICLSINYDYDIFAKLIIGESLIENGVFPYQDFLSYTPTHTWYDHEWGSGVIFYLILKYIGPIGFLILQACIMFGISVFIIKIQKLQKHALPPSMLFMTVFLSFFMAFNASLVRCQLFSFFFFTVFMYLLERYRKEGSNWIWLIPIITIFWNNVHGGVVAGLGLVFLYFIGAVIEKKSWKKYIEVLLVSTPLLIINPYGYKYLKFLFSAATMNRKYIVEWFPIYRLYHVFSYIPTIIYTLFCYIISLMRSLKTKQYDVTKLIIITVTLIQGFLHVKLLSLCIISIAALCYNDICFGIRRFNKLFKKVERCIYVVIMLLLFTIPLFSPAYPRASLYKFPLYEIEFLKINNIKGNILTPFGLGSYTSYKLYPNNLIYMDGRYEAVYNDKEFINLKNFVLAENNWKEAINNYNTDILMPVKTSYAYDALLNEPDWTLLYDGRICGIFVKTKEIKDSYIEPEDKVDYYRKTMFDGIYFGKKLRK